MHEVTVHARIDSLPVSSTELRAATQIDSLRVRSCATYERHGQRTFSRAFTLFVRRARN